MRHKRLLRLADFLVKLPRPRFNIRSWTNSNNLSIKNCGTAGCALGWACTIPYFKRLGLKLEGHTPNYLGYRGLEGAKKFFGISDVDAYSLFMPASYTASHPTPKVVAKNIRRLVKKHQRGKALAA